MASTELTKYAILYVDDEEQSLKYFPMLFKDFRCLTAKSAQEARQVFAQQGDSIGVLITDQRMPGESGVDLLTWVRSAHPRVVRILTTAFTDLDSAIASVNTGEIYRYVVKPWNARELLGVLMHALEYHVIARERDSLLREKLSTLQNLVMMDRLRGFAVLAAGLSARLQNTFAALKSYVDQAPEAALTAPAPDPLQAATVHQDVQAEGRQVVALAQSISQEVLHGTSTFALQPLSALIAGAQVAATALGSPTVTVQRESAITGLASDGDLLSRLFALLVTVAHAAAPAPAALVIAIADAPPTSGSPAVRVTMRLGSTPWTPSQHASLYSALSFHPGSAAHDGRLLAAHFLAQHHGGRITAHPQAPEGPGLSVVLPQDVRTVTATPVPSIWVDDILTFQRDT
jgi:FixJ family two-component response regulator